MRLVEYYNEDLCSTYEIHSVLPLSLGLSYPNFSEGSSWYQKPMVDVSPGESDSKGRRGSLSASINANSDAFETVFGLAFVARLIDS